MDAGVGLSKGMNNQMRRADRSLQTTAEPIEFGSAGLRLGCWNHYLCIFRSFRNSDDLICPAIMNAREGPVFYNGIHSTVQFVKTKTP